MLLCVLLCLVWFDACCAVSLWIVVAGCVLRTLCCLTVSGVCYLLCVVLWLFVLLLLVVCCIIEW